METSTSPAPDLGTTTGSVGSATRAASPRTNERETTLEVTLVDDD
jgi:hypothetical protein